MRAVYYDTFQKLPTIETLPDPAPTPTGVVVKVEATGLCRSDWHGWMGHDPDIKLPHVPGHELAGTIAAVGRDVKNWKLGDRVTVPFVSGCGHCGECATGHQHICDNQVQPGFTMWGSFAEHVALEYADLNLVRLPDDMSFDTAAALGCRFVTSFSAVIDKGRLKPGEWLAVHGCGGVGLSAIMIGTALGARVVAVDLTDDKLALAKALGASATINASKVKPVDAIREVTGGGAHVSIDALGHSITALNSVRCLRKRGRHVQVGLMLAEHARAPMPMDRIISWELEIKGSHGMQAHRYPDMLRMIAGGVLAPQKMITRTIPLADAPAALAAMDRFEGTGITIIRP
ncbi:MAG: zinc-dependent alcohol dehydrogenase family protein [Hyphomicrobiales bacterium]